MAEQPPAVPHGAELMGDDANRRAWLTFNEVERNGTEARDEGHDGFGNMHINREDTEACINSFPPGISGEIALGGRYYMVLRQQDGNGEAYKEDRGSVRDQRKEGRNNEPRVTIIWAHQARFVSDGDDGRWEAVRDEHERQQKVVIKRYRRGVDTRYIWRTLKEIALMQAHGDNVHILKPITVLQDEYFVYLVLPRACEWGSLDVAVQPLSFIMREDEYRDWVFAVFRKILKILLFLCRHNICHHDLSAGNFLFLREDPDSLVAFDLELAHRIPVEPTTGRQLIADRYWFGTKEFLAPEAFCGQADLQYDGVAIDLWSAAMCLAFMLMGGTRYICGRPHHRDQGFSWLIMRREQQGRPSPADIPPYLRRTGLIEKVEAYNRMAGTYPNATNVLEGIFVRNPRTRAVTLGRACEQFFPNQNV